MIHDLCIIMLTAGIVSLLFKLFKQPVVLGYIVAGMIAGPYVCGASWISDEESVEMWGQIGVLFLLFAMGLEFSFKKLMSMGSTALVAVSVIVIGMMSVGFLVGKLFAWDDINSLFLGGMLCMSSTTIVFKAIEDLGLSSNKFASVTMGILIVEDLFAVVLMVLLSSIAVNQKFAGEELVLEIIKLVAYLILWFVLGIYILPTFFRKFKKHLNDETLTIIAIGLCLGMVLLASSAGFSTALGAFVMGSILAETLEAERIEILVQPIKNVFGSIFFVSVGMMLNPDMLIEYWLPILTITIIVILGQITFASFGTLLSGQSLKVSLQTGFSLVQIGEFAFIIASFGQTSGVTSPSLYPIVVAVSVITTFLTPYVMRMAGPTEKWLNLHMSESMKMLLDNYCRKCNTVSPQRLWKSYLNHSIKIVLIFSIILTFIYFVYFTYVYQWIQDQSSLLDEYFTPKASNFIINIVSLILLLAISSPFLYGMISGSRKSVSQEMWNAGGYQRLYIIIIRIVRLLIAIYFVGYAISEIFTLTYGVLLFIAFVIIMSVRLSHSIRKQSVAITQRFTSNLSAREEQADKQHVVSTQFANTLSAYDIHIADIQIPLDSQYSGKSLQELDIRNKSGVSVVRIIRASVGYNIPGGKERIYAGDRLVVAGTDEQIDLFKQMIIGSVTTNDENKAHNHVSLERIILEDNNRLIGKTLRESGIREQVECVVMVIEREGNCIMSPEPDIILQKGDMLLVAGEVDKLKGF